MRSCLILVTTISLFFAMAGCNKQPPAPTAEEAAKAPPLPPPKGAESSRTMSDN